MQVDGRPFKENVRDILAEGYKIWASTALPALPESERYAASDSSLSVYGGEFAANLAAACQCYWLFRKLHRMVGDHPVHATLLGDYFFSLFSQNLIPVDSVELNNEFARILAEDTQKPMEMGDYLCFIGTLPMVLKS